MLLNLTLQGLCQNPRLVTFVQCLDYFLQRPLIVFERFAETFLSQFVSSYIDFENLEYQCHDRDLAYIEIDHHTI